MFTRESQITGIEWTTDGNKKLENYTSEIVENDGVEIQR